MLYGWKENSMLTNCLGECAHLTTTVSQTERYIGRKSSFSHSPLAFDAPVNTPFTLMRFKPRFSAILQPQRTAGNRKYTADEPRVSVTFRTFRACSRKN